MQLQLPGLADASCLDNVTGAKLAAISIGLGARTIKGWSPEEERLVRSVKLRTDPIPQIAERICRGQDPLGEAFCILRTPEERRKQGATYTPLPIIEAMLDWAATQGEPDRIVDPGTGSGRFLLAAARRFPLAQLVGVELDPLAALLGRANLAATGLARRSEVLLADYRDLELPKIAGRTLYLGNPPYVRHHLIDARWKGWLISESRRLDARASQLAGLHAYFFLATARSASPGDYGAFITAAEWLDVNYGVLIRDLFLGQLGGRRIVIVEPTATPFPDAATTAAVTCFEIGAKPKAIQIKRVATVDELKDRNGNRVLRRERLEAEPRWSHLTRGAPKGPDGYVELGELCRVHRGQVTGANRVWIAGPHSQDLPRSVLFPTVTRALELFRAGRVLQDSSALRCVIDLPIDLSILEGDDRVRVDEFLRYARRAGAHAGYVATNRKAWWSVGLRDPAPILATYMARRPPAFVQNQAAARHINIAHGIYPREPLTQPMMNRLIEHLSSGTHVSQGRTYAGGLTKFEPREMERLLVPGLDLLKRGDV